MGNITLPYPSSNKWETDEGGFQALSVDDSCPRYLTYSWDHAVTEENEDLGIQVRNEYCGHISRLFKFYAGTEIYHHEEFGVWFLKILFSGLDTISIPIESRLRAKELEKFILDWETANTI